MATHQNATSKWQFTKSHFALLFYQLSDANRVEKEGLFS